MTYDEFRQNPDLVRQFKEVLQFDIMQIVLEIMQENNPRLRSIPSDITPVVANIHLGRINGYSEYHDLFLELATKPKVHEKVKETYAAETEG